MCELAVHEDELPHARPDGKHFLGLWGTFLPHALVELFEDVMLKRVERLECNLSQLSLHGQWKVGHVLVWITAAE